MDVKKHLQKLVFGKTVVMQIALAAFTSAADGKPAVTTWTAYLYQGPGQHYAVVDEVPQGTRIDVDRCASGWCRITLDRRIGYLSKDVIAETNPAGPAEHRLPQPAALVKPNPQGPCLTANQTGGNGGNAMTIFCRR